MNRTLFIFRQSFIIFNINHIIVLNMYFAYNLVISMLLRVNIYTLNEKH